MTVTNQTLLSDNRQIAGTTWRELKIEAMADDYQQHTWYAPLTPCERQLLGALRASQMKRGNMQELQVQASRPREHSR